MWRGEGAPAPFEAVWFRAPEDADLLRGPSPFRSRNWESETEKADGPLALGERDFKVTDASRYYRLPWYNSAPPAPYTGRGCGTRETVWREGGIWGFTPPIFTDERGVASCCDLAEIQVGGELEGDLRRRARVRTLTGATPTLASARVTAQGEITRGLAPGETVLHYHAPGDTPYHATSWDRGGFWDGGFPGELQALYAGEYQANACIMVDAAGATHSPRLVFTLWAVTSAGTLAIARASAVVRPGLDTLIPLSCGDRVRLEPGNVVYASLLNPGSDAYVYHGDTGTSLSLAMIATANAPAEATGICNVAVESELIEPSNPQCHLNPTECCSPLTDSLGWGWGLADVVTYESETADSLGWGWGLADVVTYEAPVAPILLDEFVDVDGTDLTAHTMNIGPGWTTVTSVYEIEGNTCFVVAAGSGYQSDAGASDGTLKVTADVVSGGETTAVFRYGSSINLHYAVISETLFEIRRFTKTGTAVLASMMHTFSLATQYAIVVVMAGDQITATCDGQTLGPVTDSTGQFNTQHGLGCNAPGVTFTHFEFDP